MKLNEFIVINMVKGLMRKQAVGETLKETFDRTNPQIPRIVCKDGFTISIQCGCSLMCGSENGFRKFGFQWKVLEWGYPSEQIDPEKYNMEHPLDAYDENGELRRGYKTDATTSIGFVETEILDELLDNHGGIDLEKTEEKRRLDNTQRALMGLLPYVLI